MTLGVGGQEEEGNAIAVVVVDHSRPAPLSTTARAPTKLAHATRAGDQNPGCRIAGDVRDELLALVVL